MLGFFSRQVYFEQIFLLDLHCLPMSQKWDARLIWVNFKSDSFSRYSRGRSHRENKSARKIDTSSITANSETRKRNANIHCRE